MIPDIPLDAAQATAIEQADAARKDLLDRAALAFGMVTEVEGDGSIGNRSVKLVIGRTS